MKKKRLIVALIFVMITLGFGVVNYSMVVQTTKENTTHFENKILELEKGIVDEKKENKISAINGLKELEKEIDTFNKKVILVTVNKESFKGQSQKVKDKIKEATENVNALYKSKLDANVKDQNTVSKEELSSMMTNLDGLVKEIRDDKILTEEQIKPFEDKANEMKLLYANKIKEIEEAEAKAKAEADAKAKVEAEAQANQNAREKSNNGRTGNGTNNGNGTNAGNGGSEQNNGGGNTTTHWGVDGNGNKIPGTGSTWNHGSGDVIDEDGNKWNVGDWLEEH